jgi:MFS family permease
MTTQTSLRPYRIPLGFSFFNATTWMIALGTPMVLLAGELGASSFEVGLLYAFFFLLLPVQIISTLGLPRFGYKKQVTFGWSMRAVFLFIPLGLALLAPEEPRRWMVMAFIGSGFFFAFFRSVGSCGIMPWIYAIVPDEVRGRYFATDQILTGIAGLMTLLLSAGLFMILPVFTAFAFQYSYALAGSIIAVVFLLNMPAVEKPEETSAGEIFRQAPRLCMEAGAYRRYLVFMIFHNLVGSGMMPFMAYYLLVQVGLPAEQILLFTAIQYGGAILGSNWVRPRADRWGPQPVFRVSIVLSSAVFIFWVFLISGYSALLSILPLAYLVFGFSTSNWAIANLKYLPQVCPSEDRALSVSVHSSVVGVLGGLAPIAWGFFIKEAGGQPGVNADAFVFYFIVAAVVYAGLFFAVQHLKPADKDAEGLHNTHFLMRPFRYVSHLILPVGRQKKK